MAAGNLSQSAKPIPFTVIGGFLGAGKTTFLNQLIAQSDIPRFTILVNDFGDIAIDESLIREHDGNTIALKNGCVCCSIGNDFSRALSEAINLKPRPEHILVEASGVANPARIMDVARISPDLKREACLVIVDARALADQLEDTWIRDTVRVQLSSADILVLNKHKTVSADVVAQTVEYLKSEFPGVSVSTEFDQSWSLLRDLDLQAHGSRSELNSHAGFDTRTLITPRVIDPDLLEAWIKSRQDVYRVKGWVRISPKEYRLCQAVGPYVSWSDVQFEHEENSTLVLIGQKGLPDSDTLLGYLVST